MRAFDASRVVAAVVGATASAAPATSVATARCGTCYPRTRGVLTPCTALSWAESGIRTHRLAAILTTVLAFPACGGEGGPGRCRCDLEWNRPGKRCLPPPLEGSSHRRSGPHRRRHPSPPQHRNSAHPDEVIIVLPVHTAPEQRRRQRTWGVRGCRRRAGCPRRPEVDATGPRSPHGRSRGHRLQGRAAGDLHPVAGTGTVACAFSPESDLQGSAVHAHAWHGDQATSLVLLRRPQAESAPLKEPRSHPTLRRPLGGPGTSAVPWHPGARGTATGGEKWSARTDETVLPRSAGMAGPNAARGRKSVPERCSEDRAKSAGQGEMS